MSLAPWLYLRITSSIRYHAGGACKWSPCTISTAIGIHSILMLGKNHLCGWCVTWMNVWMRSLPKCKYFQCFFWEDNISLRPENKNECGSTRVGASCCAARGGISYLLWPDLISTYVQVLVSWAIKITEILRSFGEI